MPPSHVQYQFESEIQQFFLWYRDNSEPGICGYTRECNCTFVPSPKLQDLFRDHERTTRLLHCIFGADNCSVDARTISGRYEKTFAILLLIGRGPHIEKFLQAGVDDVQLPLDSLPDSLSSVSAQDPEFFATFYRCQWQFCAHVFEQSYNRLNLRNETVLPITSLREIRNGPGVEVMIISIHPAYNKLSPDESTFVLKRYCTPEAASYFEAELDAFRTLNLGDGGAQMVGFFGTFEQHSTFNVVFQFAEYGTLLDYFQTNPPVRAEDILVFWRNLFDLVKILESIHKMRPGVAREPQVLQGWHGYINPANILVKKGSTDSKFDVNFKLDTGIEHFINTRHTPAMGRSSRAYEAPECFAAGGHGSEADIWSFGCILSDACTWVVRGLDGLEEYRMRRKSELQRLGALTDEYSFHDGTTRLQCVDEWHAELFEYVRPTDKFSEPVTNLLLEALGDLEERPLARQLLAKSKRFLAPPGAARTFTIARRPVRTNTTGSATGSTTSSYTQRDPHGPITPPESVFGLNPPLPRAVEPNQYREQPPRTLVSQNQQSFYNSGSIEQNDALLASPLSYARSGSSRGATSTAPTSPISPPIVNRRTQDSLAPRDILSGVQTTRINSLGSALEVNNRQSSYSNVTSTSGGDRRDQSLPLQAVEGSPRPSSSLMRTESARAESATLPAEDHISVASNAPESPPLVDNSPVGAPPSYTSVRAVEPPATTTNPPIPATQQTVQHAARRAVLQGIQQAAQQRTAQPAEEQQMRANPRAAPFLAVSRLHAWRQDMREKSSSITIDTAERHHLLPANGRDHVFLIDDCFSMQSHWLDVTSLFSDFSYFIKGLPGPEGMNLCFAISTERKRSKATSDFLKILEKRIKIMETAGPSTSNMESRLGTLLGEYTASLEAERAPPGRAKHSPFVKKPPPVKPLSLHVWTDGLFQPSTEIQNPIRELEQKLTALRHPKTQVAINIVQFGQDEAATRRLKSVEKSHPIVDVEPFKDGNVWKMLNGAINAAYKEPQLIPALPAPAARSPPAASVRTQPSVQTLPRPSQSMVSELVGSSPAGVVGAVDGGNVSRTLSYR